MTFIVLAHSAAHGLEVSAEWALLASSVQRQSELAVWLLPVHGLGRLQVVPRRSAVVLVDVAEVVIVLEVVVLSRWVSRRRNRV